MLPPLCRFSESTCMVLRVLQIPASRLRVLSPAPLPPAAHLRAPRETGTPNELFIVPLRHWTTTNKIHTSFSMRKAQN